MAGSAAGADPEPHDDDDMAPARPSADVVFERGYMRIPAPVVGSGDGADDDADAAPAELGAAEAAAAEVLSAEEIAKAFKYGSSYVIPVAGDTIEWKYCAGERSFKVLGTSGGARALGLLHPPTAAHPRCRLPARVDRLSLRIPGSRRPHRA